MRSPDTCYIPNDFDWRRERDDFGMWGFRHLMRSPDTCYIPNYFDISCVAVVAVCYFFCCAPYCHSLSSRYMENYSSGWQPTDQIEEVEPPHSLTWQPTQIEEVELPYSLTWQPTQIEEVELPYSLTSPPHYGLPSWQPTEIEEFTWQPTQIEEVEPPYTLKSLPHTLTHSHTSRTRRTGSGIMYRVIALFTSRHKKKHQPTTEEKKMLKEICATNRVHKNHIVKQNRRTIYNKDGNYSDRRYRCTNCPDSYRVYSNQQMIVHSRETHADMPNICEKCGLAYETKHECPMQKTKNVSW